MLTGLRKQRLAKMICAWDGLVASILDLLDAPHNRYVVPLSYWMDLLGYFEFEEGWW